MTNQIKVFCKIAELCTVEWSLLGRNYREASYYSQGRFREECGGSPGEVITSSITYESFNSDSAISFAPCKIEPWCPEIADNGQNCRKIGPLSPDRPKWQVNQG
jgi:hypothetical protein